MEGKKTGDDVEGKNAREMRGINDGGIRGGEEEGEIVEGRLLPGKEEERKADGIGERRSCLQREFFLAYRI